MVLYIAELDEENAGTTALSNQIQIPISESYTYYQVELKFVLLKIRYISVLGYES